MTSSPDRAGPAAIDTVSAELIAEITERVKREGKYKTSLHWVQSLIQKID